MPHIKYPLRKQKFHTWAKALQEALQLEENQYKHTDPSVEYLREDLKNMAFQLNQNKGKEKREVVWCTLCKTKGHHKNEFPTFEKYLGARMSNHLPSGGPWCEICITDGHDPYHCPMMQKYQKIPKSTSFDFCKSVGHEEKDYKYLEIIKERTSNTYRV